MISSIKRLCFNSKMVRLKGKIKDKRLLQLLEFQFQNGTIKRTAEIMFAIMFIMFQFQNGTIKSYKLF